MNAPPLLPKGYRLLRLEQTGSTNADALEAGLRGEAGGLWIVADRQNAGKGSRGREWVSQQGNLFASLLMRDPAPAINLPQLTFVAALAVRQAMANMAVAQGLVRTITLKWPNDILVQGGKASGILLESRNGDTGCLVVVGVGVNCVSHPQDTMHRATDLASEGIVAQPVALLGEIAACMADWLAAWDAGNGFAAVRNAWLAQATGVGQRIHVRLPDRELSGSFAELANDGNLIMLLDDGSRVRISTADIFFTNQT